MEPHLTGAEWSIRGVGGGPLEAASPSLLSLLRRLIVILWKPIVVYKGWRWSAYGIISYTIITPRQGGYVISNEFSNCTNCYSFQTAILTFPWSIQAFWRELQVYVSSLSFEFKFKFKLEDIPPSQDIPRAAPDVANIITFPEEEKEEEEEKKKEEEPNLDQNRNTPVRPLEEEEPNLNQNLLLL